MPLEDRITNVLELLLTDGSLRKSPLTFICHSLGGLIVKQVVLELARQKDSREEASALLRHVHQVVFCATPHTGSRQASLLDKLGFLAWPSSISLALVADAPSLRKTNIDYRELADQMKDRLFHRVFFETQDTHGAKTVNEGSADPGLRSAPIPIDANHITIVKPADRSSLLYVIVREFLTMNPLSAPEAGEIEQLPLPSIQIARSSNVMPRALRVLLLLLAVSIIALASHSLLGPGPGKVDGTASDSVMDALTFAAILAAISDDEERVRVAQLHYRRTLSSEEQDVVINIRSKIKTPPTLTAAAEQQIKKAANSDELDAVLAGLDRRACGGTFQFSIKEDSLLQCQSGEPIPELISPKMGGPLVSLEAIVFHFTGDDSLRTGLKVFQNKDFPGSAHLLVGRNGAVIQLVPFNRQAWHAGPSTWKNFSGLNKYSIGIDFVNAGELTKQADGGFTTYFGKRVEQDQVFTSQADGSVRYWQKYTPHQIAAAIGIVRAFKAIDPNVALLGHSEISPGRVDPGPAFPIQQLRSDALGVPR
jgi:hypothetical protein